MPLFSAELFDTGISEHHNLVSQCVRKISPMNHNALSVMRHLPADIKPAIVIVIFLLWSVLAYFVSSISMQLYIWISSIWLAVGFLWVKIWILRSLVKRGTHYARLNTDIFERAEWSWWKRVSKFWISCWYLRIIESADLLRITKLWQFYRYQRSITKIFRIDNSRIV